jgi:arylsulfatase A-like enzyme
VDDEIQKIVRLVRKYGDKRKTFFIFTSDNGLELGAHRIEFKDYLYEESERVPLIIRGPGVPQNTTGDQLVANIDLAPTISAIAKARPGRVMDGIDLLPLTRDPGVANNRTLLFESFDLDSFGVRQGPWSYNVYSNGDDELYNLDNDPYQLTNVADNPGQATRRATLRAELQRLRTCSGAGCQ